MLLAENLLLLLTEDVTGKSLISHRDLELGLAGACLADLCLRDRLDLAQHGEPVRAGRLVLREGQAVDDPVLEETLRRLTFQAGKRPTSALPAIAKGLRPGLLARLESQGVLHHEKRRVLGAFAVERWPLVSRARTEQLQQQVTDALLARATPHPSTAALVALLSAVDATHRVVRGSDLSTRELKKRAKPLREASWVARATASAVSSANADVASS